MRRHNPRPSIIGPKLASVADFIRILIETVPLLQTQSRGGSVRNRILQEYDEKYGTYIVAIWPTDELSYDEGVLVSIDDRAINVQSFDSCVEFLQYFGIRITKLFILYVDFELEKYDALQQLIHDTCGGRYPDHGGSFVEIRLFSPLKFPINRNQAFGPFYNVENVYLDFTQLE